MALLLLHASALDPRSVLFAKHAQHVVLIHFPIALFITAVAFDVLSHLTKRQAFAEAAYFNVFAAALSVPAVLVTGLLAWHFQLEGQKLQGVLFMHLLLACTSSALILAAWWLHFCMRRRRGSVPSYRIVVEVLAVLKVMATAHLGGFLSGVNGPG